jgi:hypothetical protein
MEKGDEGEEYAPTEPFARARIDRPENNRESYYPNTLDN